MRPPAAAPRTPWREVAYCVLDLETTGLSPQRDEIVSWATVPVDRGRIVVGGIRDGLVRPAGPVPATSVRIHGIRPTDLDDAPPLDEALDALLEAVADRVLVVHVDWVERGFLGAALRRRGMRLRGPVLDTARLAHARFPDLGEAVALTTLSRRLGLPVYAEHEARGDALTTAQVFLALATRLEREAPQTLATLAAVAALPPRRGLWQRVRRAGR
jgi:DNA polymerase-3 subunit epsilon